MASSSASQHSPEPAEPARIPTATASLERAEAERLEYIRARRKTEQHSILRGLIMLALVAILFSMWRAGADRVFVGRWWWP